MAINVKVQVNQLGKELASKLGSVGLEIVCDEETNKVQTPKKEDEEDKDNTKEN